jgi:DNA-binding NarL/FixJ family response regulator
MLRLLIADPDLTIRLGVRSVITKSSEDFSIDDVTGVDQLLKCLIAHHYELLLLDPMIAGGSTVALIKQIRDAKPETNILVYSDLDELRHGPRAIHAGAKGFLRKKCSIEELTTAVSQVSHGKMYVSPMLVEEMATDLFREAIDSVHERMTSREWEVFAMQVSGNSIQQCAQRLHLSVKTISSHKARLMEKLKVTSNSQIIQYAIAQGLLEECQSRCALLPPDHAGEQHNDSR